MVEGKHYELTPTKYRFLFGPAEPVLTLHSGESLSAFTVDAEGFDCLGNPLTWDKKEVSPTTEFKESNPLVGPIWIEEAYPGDLLKVKIDAISLNRDYAWSGHSPHFGVLTEESEGQLLLFNDPLPRVRYRWHLDLESQTATWELSHSRLKKVTIPLHPFIGSIGVAPRFGRVETALTPGEYGGNMDCPEVKEGVILYLPVWVRGGYLSFGDVHAAQGDGEISGCALETTARVTLSLEVIKNKKADWPRVEDQTHIMVVGSTRPLLNAIRIAHLELVRWLVEDYGFERWEAFELLSQVGTMRVGNVVDPNYSVVAKFPKRYLPKETNSVS